MTRRILLFFLSCFPLLAQNAGLDADVVLRALLDRTRERSGLGRRESRNISGRGVHVVNRREKKSLCALASLRECSSFC